METTIYKIYVVTNLINDKKYVGQTTQKIQRRWCQHKSAARTKKSLHFHRALALYGPENFRIDWVAASLTKSHCNWLEEQWIRTFQTYDRDFGYNTTFGGEGAKHTLETKEKLAKAKKGKPGRTWTPEQRKIASENQKGKNGNNWRKSASFETRTKMSAAHSGENNPMFGRKGAEHPAFGIKHSEESKQVRSEKLRELYT